MSDKTPVYIKDVLVKNFKCFKGEDTFSFVDEKGDWCRWTVFLGNNNTGKTNLLKAIAALEPFNFIQDLEDKKRINEASYMPLGYAKRFFYEDEFFVHGINIIPSTRLYEKTMHRFFDFGYDAASTSISNDNGPLKSLSIYGYGVVRNIESKRIKTIEEKKLNADNLFFNSNLIDFEDWYLQLDYGAKNDQEKAAQRRDLLKEVITSNVFPEINDIESVTDEQLNNYIKYKTPNGWYKFSELGFGYQSTLSWMGDFCKKMFERYPESENPLKEPAVLLIDELDLHLHPQWQREIVGYLSNIFTATQFIVTTHSPFILQSMDNVNLYTLQREGDHTLVEHHGSNRSFVGWRIEEILSEIMGLKENIQTDTYQELMKQFDEALDQENYQKGKEAFDELKKILHPQSAERKLLDIQFSQLIPNDKA